MCPLCAFFDSEIKQFDQSAAIYLVYFGCGNSAVFVLIFMGSGVLAACRTIRNFRTPCLFGAYSSFSFWTVVCACVPLVRGPVTIVISIERLKRWTQTMPEPTVFFFFLRQRAVSLIRLVPYLFFVLSFSGYAFSPCSAWRRSRGRSSGSSQTRSTRGRAESGLRSSRRYRKRYQDRFMQQLFCFQISIFPNPQTTEPRFAADETVGN